MILCVALKLLDYAFEPRFIEKAIRQYRDFAFQKLTEKSISSFRDESTATYLSALTNDAASVEADYLSQQLSVITNAVKFLGALALMLWFSPLLTAIAAALTVLPMIAFPADRQSTSGGGTTGFRPEPGFYSRACRLSERVYGGKDLQGGAGDRAPVRGEQPRAGEGEI